MQSIMKFTHRANPSCNKSGPDWQAPFGGRDGNRPVPLSLRRAGSGPSNTGWESPRSVDVTDLPPENPIRCRQCGHVVTSAAARAEKAGHHRHVFGNPAGYVFEIGCFATAPGCAVQGPATLEFTWFAGYAWRFASCAACGTHLGWAYSSGADGFFGLILERLVAES